MLKRSYSIIIVTFFILNLSIIIPTAQTASVSEPPEWVDWVIDEDTTVTGETIVVHGDVIVENGSALTLDNCVLKIDSIIPSNNGIEVEAGGELYVYNTTITSNGDFQYYYFEVYGKLMTDGADISNMCLNGLYICDTKDAIIKNSRVHDCGPNAFGICFANSTGTILKNNIYENFRGVNILGKSVVSIANNIISSNYQAGIYSTEDSEVNIKDNTISDTHGEIGTEGRGIQIQENSKVNITNNIIASNNHIGIFCGGDSEVNINNNTISDTYGTDGRGIETQGNSTGSIDNNIITSNMQVGIRCSDDSKMDISNNIITSNTDYGIACLKNPKVNINNNTISDTYGDRGRGIGIMDNSMVSITNNIITSNKQSGITCTDNSNVSINNNIVSKTGGGLRTPTAIYADEYSTVNINNNDIILNENGIIVLQLANVKVYNSRIIESTEDDIWVDNASHPTLINTEFNLNKIFFNDTESIISIGHWVDVNVQNKNNVPVQNAEITIKNKDGVEVFNSTTDYEGYVSSIPVVEYDLDYTLTEEFRTPHTIYASKLGQSASEKITVDRDRVVNFTLDVSDKLARGNLITTVVEGHDVTVEYSGNGTVSIEPAAIPSEIPNATEDIGIFVNINAVGDVEDLYITIRYSDNELEGVDEANLRMYCYFSPGDFSPGDFSPGDFEFLSPGDFTGGWVKIKNSGVDTYGNVVWAEVSHLTIFAPMAEEISKPVSKGNVWLLYGFAGITSFAILFVVYIILRRQKILSQSKNSK